jgi:hypothetical protein
MPLFGSPASARLLHCFILWPLLKFCQAPSLFSCIPSALKFCQAPSLFSCIPFALKFCQAPSLFSCIPSAPVAPQMDIALRTRLKSGIPHADRRPPWELEHRRSGVRACKDSLKHTVHHTLILVFKEIYWQITHILAFMCVAFASSFCVHLMSKRCSLSPEYEHFLGRFIPHLFSICLNSYVKIGTVSSAQGVPGAQTQHGTSIAR